MSTPLSALSALISSNVAIIEASYNAKGRAFPLLDQSSPVETIKDPKVKEATNLVIAAAAQLIATVREPSLSLLCAANSMHLTACLGVVNELNIAEILREAGSKGLHINEIGLRANSDASKIDRILRYLATHHIFCERAPNVFTLNRISALLDTEKAVDVIHAAPEEKYRDTSGVSAFVGHLTDECMRGSAFLVQHFSSPNRARSQDPACTPTALAFGTPLPLFAWLDEPANAIRRARLGCSLQACLPPNALLCEPGENHGFDWSTCREGGIVVDVGGGVGTATLILAKAHPHLRYVIQDRPAVVQDAVPFWESSYPEALQSGLVRLEAHDFFSPQPIKNASVFLLRAVVHDWPDSHVRRILTHLRNAAQPETALVIVEDVVPYATPVCAHPAQSDAYECAKTSISEPATHPHPPYPLLSNLGIVSAPTYNMDMVMMLLVNAQERTAAQFVDIVHTTGWQLKRIARPTGGGCAAHLVFVPA